MSDPDDRDGADDNRCAMVLKAAGLAALYTEVNEGEFDGKPVMILSFRQVLPDGSDFKLGFSEEAVNALMARCLGFKNRLAEQRRALAEGRDDG